MSIFCTIDKTMVFENLQKIQKTRKRFFFAIFYEYSSYKNLSHRRTYIYILLYQAILYCFHILSISHKPRQSSCAVAAMDHLVFKLKADLQLKKKKK